MTEIQLPKQDINSVQKTNKKTLIDVLISFNLMLTRVCYIIESETVKQKEAKLQSGLSI